MHIKEGYHPWGFVLFAKIGFVLILKVLSSELNMYESQSQEYKYEIERLANELLNVKKKYLTQKRKEHENK